METPKNGGAGESTVPPATEPEGPRNPFARMGGVLFNPDETFRSIAWRPDWLVPFLVILVFSSVSFFLIAPKLDYEPQMREMFEKNPNLSAQQKEKAIEESLGRVEMMNKFGLVTSVLSVAILTLILAAIFWGALRAFGAENGFKQTFAVTVYAWLPQTIKGVLVTLIAMPRSAIDVRSMGSLLKSNLGAFVDRGDSPALYALLSSVDLFNIWVIVLLTIGLAAISGFRRSKLAIMIVSLFAVYVALKVGFAALMGGMG